MPGWHFRIKGSFQAAFFSAGLFRTLQALALCVLRTSRVSPRRATYFSLLRQRNLRKRKATRWSGSLRFAAGNLRCSPKAGARSSSTPAGPSTAGLSYWGQTPISLRCIAPHPQGEPKARRIWALTPKTRRQRGRLFFAYFLLAKQKKVSSRRATPGKAGRTTTLQACKGFNLRQAQDRLGQPERCSREAPRWIPDHVRDD